MATRDMKQKGVEWCAVDRLVLNRGRLKAQSFILEATESSRLDVVDVKLEVVDGPASEERDLKLFTRAMVETDVRGGVNDDIVEASKGLECTVGECADGVARCVVGGVKGKDPARSSRKADNHKTDAVEVTRCTSTKLDANSALPITDEMIFVVCHKHIRATVQPSNNILKFFG